METENEKDYMEIDLAEVFCVLWKNLRNIFVVTLCCVLVAAGWLFAKRTAPVYESEACLQIKPVQYVFSGDSSQGSNKPLVINTSYLIDGLNTAERMRICVEILESKGILRQVADALGETGTVTAEPIKNTRLLKVKFGAGAPETARRGNELLIRAFQEYMADKGQFETRYIAGDAASSKVEAVVVSHNEAEVVDIPTLPMAPATTYWKRILAVSALLGLFLGSGFAVMKALVDCRLTTERDVEEYLGLPVIGIVPEKALLEEAMARRGQKSVWRQIGGLLWK